MRYNIRMKFLTINEALDWITSQRRDGAKFERFLKVIEKLGHPENNFKMIHVAGTNGKGSTTAFLRDGLMALGYKVGTLTSPHLITHLDRIRINNVNIPGKTFLDILNRNYDFYVAEGLNMFEMDYLIMCEYFKMEKIDFAIVEVGMGGRLDSTNVVEHPILSIITTIGLDHVKELGATKELICIEKCGIIKDNVPVLIGHLEDYLKSIVKAKATEYNSEYFELGNYREVSPRTFMLEGEIFKIKSYAKYQYHNASLALSALKVLSQKGYIQYNYELVEKAFEETLWAGRFEIINEKPLVIVDGAHNMDGVNALNESLDAIKMPKALLFSAIKTKDYEHMLKALNNHVDKLVLTTFSHPLVINSEAIAKAEGYCFNQDYAEAFETLVKEYPCVIVSGSLYFVSAFLGYFERQKH